METLAVRRRNHTPIIAAAIAGGILFVLLACGGIIFLVKNRGNPTTYTPMTVDQFVGEWQQNPAAAAAKYRRDGVELTGTLEKIGSNVDNETYLILKGSRDGYHDHAHIFVVGGKARDQLRQVSVGKRIVVKARATGQTSSTPMLTADEIRPAS